MIRRNSLRLMFTPPKGPRLESLARMTTAGILIGLLLVLFGSVVARVRWSGHDIELIARRPAAGGWSTERIVVNQGDRVRLRIRSEDVVHGFAIGRMGVDAGPIEPGKVTTVEFVASQAGVFTYYCTMWCDPNHARMRGILEVRGPAGLSASAPSPAADVTLQHLDDPRDAGVAPGATPSAARGLPLYGQRCASCHGNRGEGSERGAAIGSGHALRDRRPVDIFGTLVQTQVDQDPRRRAHSRDALAPSTADRSHARFTRGWSDQERWDVVAALWSFGSTADALDLGRRLYQKNCAACHGEQGTGDGPGGKSQPKKPANFTDARRMLAGTTSLYTAKIRRGGMGTGMPYWGSIFTEDELAAVVDYLWTFSIDIAR